MRSDRNSNGPTNDPTIEDVTGDFLAQAIDWFIINDIPLHGIQYCPNQHTWTTSNKAYGQLILDDISLGMPLITWEYVSGFGWQPQTNYASGRILGNLPVSTRPYVDWGNTRQLLKEKGII